MNEYFVKYQVKLEPRTDLATGRKMTMVKEWGKVITASSATNALDIICKEEKKKVDEVRLVEVRKL